MSDVYEYHPRPRKGDERRFVCRACGDLFVERWHGDGPLDFEVDGPHGDEVRPCPESESSIHDMDGVLVRTLRGDELQVGMVIDGRLIEAIERRVIPASVLIPTEAERHPNGLPGMTVRYRAGGRLVGQTVFDDDRVVVRIPLVRESWS